ncbi:MAG: DNA starvation/stationary phase protection protein [Vulcanimicrobiota bacterium]
MDTLEKHLEELQKKHSFGKPERKAGSFEENPIGLSNKVAKEIGVQLDRHQASLFVLFHQYQKHHWLVEGPQWRDLHLYLEEAYNQIHADLDVLAERLTVLGGVPSSGPAALLKAAYIEHEPEGKYSIRASLENSMAAEKIIAGALRTTIGQASKAGDYGTEHLLKVTLEHTEDRAHHLEHYLAGDKL